MCWFLYFKRACIQGEGRLNWSEELGPLCKSLRRTDLSRGAVNGRMAEGQRNGPVECEAAQDCCSSVAADFAVEGVAHSLEADSKRLPSALLVFAAGHPWHPSPSTWDIKSELVSSIAQDSRHNLRVTIPDTVGISTNYKCLTSAQQSDMFAQGAGTYSDSTPREWDIHVRRCLFWWEEYQHYDV